jgi:RNA polymerase sigma-70 factor (ECF subfamily)
MTWEEPTREWQDQQHRRILKGEATAFAELCELALPHLVTFLRSKFAYAGNEDQETSAIDSLLTYHANPSQFRIGGISLFAYLRMSARYDMLNALDQKNRREWRWINIDSLDGRSELQGQEPFTDQLKLDEMLQEYTSLSFSDILNAVQSDLDEMERKILWLMLEGERSTERYAETMEITHLDEQAQREEVKRVKDRLMKKLRRLGNRLKKT